ncbi:short chain dehydrogenase/reductase domain protein [Mycobacterium xenopi 3993]|nr:short chain dehydrogenase/reductase domain protein [Mycobacterium xenopi 3993]
MLGPPTPGEEVVSRKAASILNRSNPDYLVDVLDKTATEGGKR